MVRPRSLRLILLAAGAAALAAPALAAPQALTAQDLQLLNRVTWGADPASIAQMQALGPRRWLDRQLHPSPDDRLPDAVQAEIDALQISRTPTLELVAREEAERRATKLIADPEQKKAAQQAWKRGIRELARQAAYRSLLRDIYSPDQLQEQMTWFWANHFNVFAYKGDVAAFVSDYEEAAIRPRALGKFRDLLEATLRQPAMLRYLDNAQNAAGQINENYAREIMELHTMGVGSGYTQKDVQELARVLTGVGINVSTNAPKLKPEYQGLYIRDGLFEFNPNRHDFGDKVFLGHQIKGSGFREVEQALDILARQPATAHHVSYELAQYFTGDEPPPALVDRMARAFQRTDGDIAQVLKTLFASPEFTASLGTEFKDPMHYVVSAVRLAYGDRTVVDTTPMERWLARMSEAPYGHQTPDGYPMASAAWSAPGQLAVRFDVAQQIGSGAKGLFTPQGAAPAPPSAGAMAMTMTPASSPTEPQAQMAQPQPAEPPATLQQASLELPLAEATRQALSQASSPRDWNMLFLSSPEFMRR